MALGERDRRALIILGAVLGVALIAFLVVKVTGGGSEQAAPIAPVSPVPTAAPSVSSSPTKAPPAAETFNGRDPFSPPAALATAAAGGGGGGGTGGGGGSTTVPPTGSTSPPPVIPTTPSTGGGGNNGGGGNGGGNNHHHNSKPGDTKKVGGKTVKLVAVRHPGGKKEAQILVDEAGYVLRPGEKFDSNFKLVAIEGQCTRIVYGDQKFELCAKASNKKSAG